MATLPPDNPETSVNPEGFASADREVDARGMLCPEPLLRCRLAMEELEPGGIVLVLATDLHAEIDFEVFARRTRHELLRRAWLDGVLHVLIRKG